MNSHLITVRGSLLMTRVQWRSAWRSLLGWAIGLVALVVVTARSIEALYPSLPSRMAYAATAGQSPGTVAFNGRWSDLTTVGGITSNEVGFLGLLLFPLAGILLAVRVTRREEDAGRTELLTAAPIGRLDPLLGGALAASSALSLTWPLTTVGLMGVGLPTTGSMRYAAAMTLYALAWLAVGLVCAEASRDARTATGLALSLLLVSYLVRTVVDALELDLAGLSPMGWVPATSPFAAEPPLWPYLSLVGLTVVALLVAALIALRRDLGGGLVSPRPGPARGAAALGSPLGLSWRLLRGLAVGWLIGLSTWSLALGLLVEDMTEVIAGNPQLMAVLGIDAPEDVVTALTLTVAALGSAAFAVQSAARLGTEETSGRLGLLLAAPTPPWRLWSAWTLVTAVTATTLMVGQGMVYGISAALVTDSRGVVGDSVGAAAVLTVPVLLVAAVAMVLRTLLPRWQFMAWLLVGWGAVVGFLAEALDLPDSARDVSVFHAVGQVPLDDPRWPAVSLLGLATLVLLVVSVTRAGSRDLQAG